MPTSEEMQIRADIIKKCNGKPVDYVQAKIFDAIGQNVTDAAIDCQARKLGIKIKGATKNNEPPPNPLMQFLLRSKWNEGLSFG